MGIRGWFERKAFEKSASNIVGDLPALVAAVREDLEGASGHMGQVDALAAAVEKGQDLSEAEIKNQMQALENWRSRKAKVIKAQKKLYRDVTLRSSLPPERSLKEILLPALYSGQLVSQSDPCFEPVIVAVYRVCEAAARQGGATLEEYVTVDIRRMIDDAGDLYK